MPKTRSTVAVLDILPPFHESILSVLSVGGVPHQRGFGETCFVETCFLETCFGPGSATSGAENLTTQAHSESADPGPTKGLRNGIDSGFSIRLGGSPAVQPCRLCGKVIRAVGPTGYLGEHVICDGCLLCGERPLGLALLLLGICRSYGAHEPEDGNDAQRRRRELMAFARIYHRQASEQGEARPWSDFFSELKIDQDRDA